MRTPYVRLALGLASLSLSTPLIAGPGGGVGVDDRPRPIEILWEWGEPALESARELRSGLIGPDGPTLSLDGEIETHVIIPNALPLNRAYQVRLRGELLDNEGRALPEGELLGEWQPFDPRNELVEVLLPWSPAGLGLSDAQPLTAHLSAEVALATATGEELLIMSDPFELGVRLEVAAAMIDVKPDEPATLSIADPLSPLNGAELEIPSGALGNADPQVVALMPASTLPFHPGYRVWSGQPLELRTEGGSDFVEEVQLTLPLLPGTEASGVTFWNSQAGDYEFLKGARVGEGLMQVATQRATIWGPTSGEDEYEFEMSLATADSVFPEFLCDDSRCPEGTEFLIADTRLLNLNAPTLSAHLRELSSGGSVNLGDSNPLGRCLESSWGRVQLDPDGQIFGDSVALHGLPSNSDSENICGAAGVVYAGLNPTSRALTNAKIPGWGEFASWIVPSSDYWYTGTPSTNCSPETLAALEEYLELDPLETREVPGSTFGGPSVTQARLIFDCLWLRLDPSLESSTVAFGNDGLPTQVVAELPGELSASERDAFVDGTSATLLHWSAGADDAPESEDAAKATLLNACETGEGFPASARSLALNPISVEGDSTTVSYSLGSTALDEPDLNNAVAYLRLSQAGDAASRSCIPIPWGADSDGDGFPSYAWNRAEQDCDDTDPNSNPGGIEVCDGADNDCDDSTDEGLLVEAYPDNDNDGYAADVDGDGEPDDGVITSYICAEAEVDNWSVVLGDCDDGDGDISPLALEVCDGVDQDCDNGVDEGVLQRFYVDGDGDGYGAGAGVDLCAEEATSGYAVLNGDCDDSEPSHFPGAPTACNDLDEDCDGRVDESPAEPVYVDADDDGFGVGIALSLCPSGPASETPGDCDDSDPSRYPGAPQVPAIATDGSGSYFFGCNIDNALPLVSVDGQGLDALYLPSDTSIQGHVDALNHLQGHIDLHDLGGLYQAPEILKLEAGTYRGSALIDGRALRIEGTLGPEGAETRLEGEGAACVSQGLELCSTIVARNGADLDLRGLRIEGGMGSSLRAILGEGNVTSTYGGGVAAIDSEVVLDGVSISDNSAEVGAGLAVVGPNSSLEMRHSEVRINTINHREGVAFGGGIYVEGGEVSIFESDISLNRREGVYQEGSGGGLVLLDARGRVVSSSVVGNGAEAGAGILVVGSDIGGTLDIRNNIIQDNDAEGPGGGLLVSRVEGGELADWRVQGNIIQGNTSLSGYGGGVFINGAPFLFRNNLLRENSAEQGGGGITFLGEGVQRLENVIFDQNLLGAGAGYGDDLMALSSGVLLTEGSILLPALPSSVPCNIQHEASGYFGVPSPGVLACPNPAGLGELIPPEGADTPFMSYGPFTPDDDIDWHLRPGTEIVMPSEFGEDPTYRGLEESATGLGIWGGEGSRLGLRQLDLSCLREVPAELLDVAAGELDGTFVFGSSDGVGEGATEAYLVNVAPGSTLDVEILEGDGDIQVELFALYEGRCGEGDAPHSLELELGESAELDTAEGGLFILKLSPLQDWYGPYALSLEEVAL